MKRVFRVTSILLIILILGSTVFAEPIKVMVENSYLELLIDPVSEDGRTLVPLRAIFEAMGATVEWEQSTKTITGVQGDKIIILQLDNKIATVNGKEVELDVPAKAINGTTLVPVRFIAESLGAEVDWDQSSKTVLVNSTIIKEPIVEQPIIKEEVKSYDLKAKPGEFATVTIKGTPGVEYKINVYYSSGRSTAKGLEPKRADGNGDVSWTWIVGAKTKPGKYRIVIIGDKTEELQLEVLN